jgi:acetyltransferase-like isoleucine patch superfamily enzyme
MKRLLRAAFVVPAWLELARFRMARALIGEERAFLALTERLARRPGYFAVYLRAAVYSRVLKRSSPELHIGFGTCLSKAAATLGDHVYVGRFCSLGWVEIERDVMIADFVSIPSGSQTHSVFGSERVAPRDQEPRFSAVHIGEGTWIGAHAVVMADVGRFCIVGAGAVVTRPIPDHTIALGVPARPAGSTSSGARASTSRPEEG